MKKITGFLLLALGVLTGFARWLDLVNFTDPVTEFVLEGSIWLRYGALAALVLVAALGCFLAERRPARCERKNPVLGLFALLASAAFAALGGVGLLAGSDLAARVSALLALCTAWWLASLGLAWYGSQYRLPCGGIAGGVLGGAWFYMATVLRFMQNHSSYHRTGPVVSLTAALLALVFAMLLLRAVQRPESRCGRKLMFSGLAVFYLCTCVYLPQAVYSWMNGQYVLSQMAESGALAVLGLLGAAVAMNCLSDAQPDAQSEGSARE